MTSGTAPQLDVRIDPGPDGLLVSVTGDLDVYTADRLVDQVILHLPENPVLILDLAGVPFCDSYGVRALIAVRRHCERNDRVLHVVNLSPTVEHLLVDMLGLGGFLGVPGSPDGTQPMPG